MRPGYTEARLPQAFLTIYHTKTKNLSLFGCRTTYSETTSGGKVWGTDRTFSHRALSFVQIHPAGHLGCLTLRPSAKSKLTAATQTKSVHPLHPLPGYPIPSVPADNYLSWTIQLKKRGTGNLCFLIFFLFFLTSWLFWWQKLVLWRSDAASCLCFLRLNRKAPVQRIRSARRRITNAGQRENSHRFFLLSWKGIIWSSQIQKKTRVKNKTELLLISLLLTKKLSLVDPMLRPWKDERIIKKIKA